MFPYAFLLCKSHSVIQRQDSTGSIKDYLSYTNPLKLPLLGPIERNSQRVGSQTPQGSPGYSRWQVAFIISCWMVSSVKAHQAFSFSLLSRSFKGLSI